MTHLTENHVVPRPSRVSFRSIVQAILRADKAFRDKQHLRSLPDFILKDVGIRREDLD